MPEAAKAVGNAFKGVLDFVGDVGAVAGSILVGGIAALGSIFAAPSMTPSSQKEVIRQPTAPRRRYYGKNMIGGVIAFIEVRTRTNFSGSESSPHLHVLIMLAAHEIDGIEEFWIGDQQVTLNGSNLVNEAPFFTVGVRRAKLVAQLGTADQAAHPDLTAVFSEWTANHRLRGVANVLCIFKSVEAHNFNKVFPNGIPQVRVLARTSKCWNPAASGQDFDDPETWQYSDNAAVVILNYILAEDGMALPYDLIEPAIDDWVDKINECDVPVLLETGGSEPRFRLAGGYEATSPPRDVLPLMLAPIGGSLRMRADGAIILELPDYYTPTVTFTDEHIFNYHLRRSPEAIKLRNEIRAKYVSPNNDYEEQEAEPWRNEASIALHGVQSATLDLTWCPSHAQARRRMKLESYRLNPDWTGTIETNAYGLDAWGELLSDLTLGDVGLSTTYEKTSHEFDPSSGRNAMGFRAMPQEAFEWGSTGEEGTEPGGDGTDEDAPPEDVYPLSVTLETDGSLMHFNISWGPPDRDDLRFKAQWSSYVPGQPEESVTWYSLVDDHYAPEGYVQKDIVGSGTVPIRVRAWFEGPTGWMSENYTYEIIGAEEAGAPDPMTAFDAPFTPQEERITFEFETPTSPGFSYLKIFRSAIGAGFGTAVEFSGALFRAPGAIEQLVYYNQPVDSGYDYWAVAYSGTGQASTEVGPVTAVVDPP